MAATTISITGTLESPDGSAATGFVQFTPRFNGAHFGNGGVTVPNTPVVIVLVGGSLPTLALVRCGASTPLASQSNPGGYSVIEFVDGAAPYGPYAIPDQAGPVDLSAFR